jgi:surface carbohydrate biosynthesis protein (TIGR04326 family)
MSVPPNTLHVLYELPKEISNSNSIVLSFLYPEKEQAFTKSFKGSVFIGRSEMNAVREKARLLYIDLVARIGATSCDGKTLRQNLALPDTGNPWWYHPFTAKNCEPDPTFNRLLHIFTIVHICEQECIQKIIFHGGSHELADVFAEQYQIAKQGKLTRDWPFPLRGLITRARYFLKFVYHTFAIKYHVKPSDIKPDIMFSGFWDWSVCLDHEKKLKDTYFVNLPDHLKAKDLLCAWFLWFSPFQKMGSNKQTLKSVLNSAKDHPQLILVQYFLTIIEIILAFADLRPLFRYLRYCRSNSFRSLFKEKNLDFWPLVNRQLAYHFCGTSLPYHKLVELAYRKALARYRPKLALTFQELFLQSRAIYQGGRLGSPETIHCTIQHCSYNREKTFVILDSKREYLGEPDECSIPKPDFVFSLGSLGRKIFLENGFSEKQVFLTGSPRYDHIKISKKTNINIVRDKHVNVLLTPTLNRQLELEMLQAVVLATIDLEYVNVFLRSHPFARMEDLPECQSLLPHLTLTKGSLEDDLDMSDLVIYTYSTVAEEAFLKGIPVWQWLPAGFDGSVIKEVTNVKSFTQVDCLRESLVEFAKNPNYFLPTHNAQQNVLDQCFYEEDGKASYRITDKILELCAK